MKLQQKIELVLALLAAALFYQCNPPPDITKVAWIHGAANCDDPDARIPGLQVFQASEQTYVLRQNKCVNYEAPFLYLFIGRERALLIDTGGEAEAGQFPLFETVSRLIAQSTGRDDFPLVVIHSHTHSDHRGGDGQFAGKPHTTLVAPTLEALTSYLSLADWPHQSTGLDLGNRMLTVIPIPGHDEASIAVYDPVTRWLLTGDSVYPGRLYVRNGKAFCESMKRLLDFTEKQDVIWLMGNHIEMSRTPGVDYPVGTQYQPEEHPLPMATDVLRILVQTCETADTLTYRVFNDFIIAPK